MTNVDRSTSSTVRKTFNRCAIAFSLACLSAPAFSAGGSPAALRSVVDAQILPILKKYDVPGMAVAIIIDGKTSYFNYGLASRADVTPVSETTLFELGSISKTFAATLASYAQVSGKLSLEMHPGEFVPQLRGSAIDAASLLNLGTYTAGGLPLQFPDHVADDETMIEYFRTWKPEAAPGVTRRYTNPGIGLLGHIAALALKGDYSDLLEQQIFLVLGLQHTHIRVPDRDMPAYAWGYDRTNRAIRVSRGQFDAQAYGVKSSSADLIRFVALNLDPAQLPLPLRQAVEGTHVAYFQTGAMLQGLGWEQYPWPVSLAMLQQGNASTMSMQSNPATKLARPAVPPVATLFNKTGSTNGFGAYAAWVPAQQFGIVLLANKNFPIPARIDAAYAIMQHATR